MIRSILSRFSFWLAIAGIVAAVLFMRLTNISEPMPPVPYPSPQKPAGHTIAAYGIIEANGENVNIGVPVKDVVNESLM